MKTLFKLLILFLFSILFLHATTIPSSDKILKVGTKIAPPFAMKDRTGRWEGISIELWDLIAKRLGLRYELREHTLKTLLDGVTQKRLDVGIAAITITAKREHKFDFSHSYYTTGLSIAIPKKSSTGWLVVIKGIFSYQMFAILSAIGLVLFIVGTITWLVEHKRNPDNFNPDPIKGISSGIWWAAVTMTTVGYGDMTPKTLGGRMVALFWMLASLLLVSSIIAGVASTLTVAKMDHLINTADDLARGKIASIEHSVSDSYLKDRRIYPHYYNDVNAALKALEKGKVDAMVYDAPLLQYSIKKHYEESIMMTGALFESQNYGIALQENSPLREKINRVMLEILSGVEWARIKHKYLGE